MTGKRKVESLEAFRYQMMVKGYMNKTELQTFLDCGEILATRAFNAMMKDIEKEGLEKLQGNIVLTKRAIGYLGLTEKKIVEAFERRCS